MARRAARRSPRRKPGARGTSATERVTRAELNALNQRIRVLHVRLLRMSDMQAELDTVKRVVERLAEQISAVASSVAALTSETQ